jgi:hypothetical protein
VSVHAPPSLADAPPSEKCKTGGCGPASSLPFSLAGDGLPVTCEQTENTQTGQLGSSSSSSSSSLPLLLLFLAGESFPKTCKQNKIHRQSTQNQIILFCKFRIYPSRRSVILPRLLLQMAGLPWRQGCCGGRSAVVADLLAKRREPKRAAGWSIVNASHGGSRRCRLCGWWLWLLVQLV